MSEFDVRNCKASLVSFRSDSCIIEQHFSKSGPGNIKVKAIQSFYWLSTLADESHKSS